MIEKTKIKFKKGVACLLATLQIQAMSGCMSNNKNIDKSTESENIAELQDSNNSANDKLEQNTEEYIQKAFESALERSEQIRNSEDPNLMIYKTYAYVSDEYKNLEGKRYVWVKVNSDDKYEGLFNLETLNEDIPCNTFDRIIDEFQINNIGGTYRWISIPGDSDYKCGLYDTANSTLIIPCKTYTDINYYKGNGTYQCTKPDGTVDTIQLPLIGNKYEKEENPEVEIGVNTNESIISREAAVSLFYKDGSINVDAVYEEPISYRIIDNSSRIITYKKELCMITKDGINYLVDPHDYSQVVFVGYNDIEDSNTNDLEHVVPGSESDIYAFKIYGQDGKEYYVDPYDMKKPILSGIDYKSIRKVYFPGYISIRDNGDGTFKKSDYCCEMIKNGVKYLTDLYDFTKILASGYEKFSYDEIDGIQRMILTYPDGSIEIYNSDALNIINSDILVTNSNMEKDFRLSLTK